jgi:hypothetical protein
MNFTSDDVVKILTASKDINIRCIKLGDLHLEFDTNFHPNKHLVNAAHMDVLSVGGGEGQPPGPTHHLSDEQPQVNDDQLMLSEMADLLSIEDPALYEELQIKMMNNQGHS